METEESRTRQREKFMCNVVITKFSASPRSGSEAGVALQTYPALNLRVGDSRVLCTLASVSHWESAILRRESNTGQATLCLRRFAGLQLWHISKHL